MHRLEVFDKATTSAKRDPDLQATVSNLYAAVSSDPLLAEHTSSTGKSLSTELERLMSSSPSSSNEEDKSEEKESMMTASEWLDFASAFSLRSHDSLPKPPSPLRPMRSPLAPGRMKRPSVLDDARPRSLTERIRGMKKKMSFSSVKLAPLNLMEDDTEDEATDAKASTPSSSFRVDSNFSAIAVSQIQSIQNHISSVKEALHNERSMVGQLRREILDKDAQIARLEKERVLMYAERNRASSVSSKMANYEEIREENERLREELAEMKKRASSSASISSHERLAMDAIESVPSEMCNVHPDVLLHVPAYATRPDSLRALYAYLGELEEKKAVALRCFQEQVLHSRQCSACVAGEGE